MIGQIINDVQNFGVNFTKLSDVNQARVILKTTVVAAATGLTTGLLLNGLLGLIVLVGTAAYVSTSVAGRMNTGTGIVKNVQKEVTSFGKELMNGFEDLATGFMDVVEDSGLNHRQISTKKQVRKVQVLSKNVDRGLSFSWHEFMHTMSL